MKNKDYTALRSTLAKDRTNLVKNKMVIFDALLQCREDYMAAAEQAVESHKAWSRDTASSPTMKNHMRDESAKTITKCEQRLEMIRKAMEELT